MHGTQWPQAKLFGQPSEVAHFQANRRQISKPRYYTAAQRYRDIGMSRVGQAIAFCGLPLTAEGRRKKPIAYPTSTTASMNNMSRYF
jgi:hypothetical protein